jgi:hypothetical protein
MKMKFFEKEINLQNTFLSKKIYFLGFIFVCLSNTGLFADTLILKTKKVYKGTVLSQNENSIEFRTNTGQQMSVSKRNVLKVLYKDLNEKEIKKVIQDEEKKNTKLLPSKKVEVEETPIVEEVEQVEVVPDSGPKRHWIDITWRSAILPGWGQFKAKRYYSSGLAFFVTFGALNNLFRASQNFSSAEKSYQLKSAPTSLLFQGVPEGDEFTSRFVFAFAYNKATFDEFANVTKRSNQAVWAFGVVYGLQLLHAIFVGKQWEKEPVLTTEGKYIMPGWNVNVSSVFHQRENRRDPQGEIFFSIGF